MQIRFAYTAGAAVLSKVTDYFFGVWPGSFDEKNSNTAYCQNLSLERRFLRPSTMSSLLQNDAWTAPVNLGPSVNSRWNDFAGRLTPDGQHLVFSSTRPVDGQADAIIQVWTQRSNRIPALIGAKSSR
jgi:hypothetical protein